MNKFISYLLTLALVIPTLASCSVQMEDIIPSQQKRTVHFSSVNQETRTGLTVGEDLVVYDWRKTDIDHVHLFEMDANGQTAYGETIKVTPSTDDLTAHFEADFSSEDMIIHVDPATRAGGTRATERVAPYKYAAVIATKPDTQLSFVVPSVQYPDAETQKDPAAEFLIGYSRKSYDEPTSFDENVVDLYFDRVVSMSRLVISNFKGSGEKVVSVTINAENGLVGSASFADIDFENASVSFVRDEGPGILTLNYGDGVDIPADGAFNAYFVTIPGKATITSMEVLTDQYRYVRSIEGGKEFTFSEKTFKNISIDLNSATAEELGPVFESTVYTKVMSNSDITADGTYVIVYENGSSSKAFKPIVSNNRFTADASNAIPATISDGILLGDADIDACQVALEAADGSNFFMKIGSYYLYPSETYIGAETTPTDSRSLTITVSNGVATIVRSRYPHYLSYDNYFLRAASGNNHLALYKLSGGSTPIPDDTEPAVYSKVSSLTAGETYLIVDVSDIRLFTGSTDGSFVSISPVNGVITDTDGVMAGYEFTVEESGSNYYLKFNDGSYLVDDYTNGDNQSGLRYMASQTTVPYPFSLTVDNGVFFFSTTQIGQTQNTNEVLYYKPEALGGTGPNRFKIGGSGRDIGVHLYQKVDSDTPSKKTQTLSFTESTVNWTLGSSYQIGQSYDLQQVNGAKTIVTYSVEPASVATIVNGKIRIVGVGTATITATAVASEEYYGNSASYTLQIFNAPSGDWVVLGPFNLENAALKAYLDDALVSYTDTNDGGSNAVTVMPTYATGSLYASIDRKDCPEPVTITWTNAASNATVISIYENSSLSNPVWTQNATANAKSADVYNLIPGRTYYYTVSEGTTIREKGYFNTTGRRRMIKVSDIEKKGHANNCRDLGGMEVTDKGVKKTIKYGYIFRGSNMDKTTSGTNSEQSILLDFLNIGMDIDLRNGSSSSSGSDDDGNSNCYRPLPSSVSYINPGFNSFTDLTTISKVKSVMTAFFTTAKSGKSTYFHCYVGADRTGYFGMLLEGLLGVSEKDCSIDYELTSFSEAVGLRYSIGSQGWNAPDYYFREGITFLRGQSGDTFQDKIENYLVNTVKINQADIDEFKSILLQ